VVSGTAEPALAPVGQLGGLAGVADGSRDALARLTRDSDDESFRLAAQRHLAAAPAGAEALIAEIEAAAGGVARREVSLWGKYHRCGLHGMVNLATIDLDQGGTGAGPSYCASCRATAKSPPTPPIVRPASAR